MKKFFDLLSTSPIGVFTGQFRSIEHSVTTLLEWQNTDQNAIKDDDHLGEIAILLEKNEELLGCMRSGELESFDWFGLISKESLLFFADGRNSQGMLIKCKISFDFHSESMYSGTFYAETRDAKFETIGTYFNF